MTGAKNAASRCPVPLRAGATLAGIALMACLPWPADGAEWRLYPSVSVAVGRDDNVTLTTGPHESVTGVYLVPQLEANRATERSGVRLGLRLSATRYSGAEVDDTSEQVLTLRSHNQTTERTRWGLDGEYRRDTLFETVRTETGVGDLRDTDIGLVSVRVRREWRVANPSWTYLLTERSSIRVNYRLTDVDFSNTAGTSVVDYREHVASVAYNRRVTVRDELSLVVNRSAYRPDTVVENKSDTTQLLAGVSREFTETMRGRFLVGANRTKQTEAGVESTKSGLALQAGVEQRGELTTLDAVVSRDVQPSGVGRTVTSDQVRLFMDRKLAPQVGFVMRVYAFRNKVLEGADPDTDRRYYELIPEVRWHWMPEWFVGFSYRYRRQKFDAEPQAAKSNAVFVSITYATAR